MKRALALLLLLLPSPALALDPVGAARIVAAPIMGKLGWTGVYGGVNGGHMNFAQARGLVLSGAAPSGFATGLRIGGDVQIQNVVIGAFLDGSRGIGSQKAVDAGSLINGVPMVERWNRPTSVSLNIRLGVPMGPMLLYSTTGYTWTTMSAAASVVRIVQGNPMRVLESYDASANGFNVGAARQPFGCTNSQHSHLTAETFVVHTGKWRFLFGANKDEGYLDVEPGDVATVPTHMFRGFEKRDEGSGFLYVVLGHDDPGKVVWAPSVFQMAADYGLKLLKGGKLIDTTLGEKVPEGANLSSPRAPKGSRNSPPRQCPNWPSTPSRATP